jgi:hypothetical protein
MSRFPDTQFAVAIFEDTDLGTFKNMVQFDGCQRV